MLVVVENEIDAKFEFDYNEVAQNVCKAVLSMEKCPFDCEIDITITDNETIHSINKETRDVDRATDVLSFPNLYYDNPSDFTIDKDELPMCVNPENNLVMLGDIILSFDKIIEQADEFGHSVLREYAFLIAHSMLHLCGYDHMQDDEATVMEARQHEIMDYLKITRD